MIEGLVLSAALFAADLEDRAEQVQRAELLTYWKDFYISTGVMEERERAGFFNYWWTAEHDLEAMQYRQKHTTPTTPPADYILPPATLCRKNWELAQSWVKYLERRVERNLWPSWDEDLVALLQDARWRLEVWAELDDCCCRVSDYKGKRLRLERVRELIGSEAFDLHQFPDPVSRAAWTATDWKYNAHTHMED